MLWKLSITDEWGLVDNNPQASANPEIPCNQADPDWCSPELGAQIFPCPIFAVWDPTSPEIHSWLNTITSNYDHPTNAPILPAEL